MTTDSQPWIHGTCTQCGGDDYVIRTHRDNYLCLECFEFGSEMPHNSVVPKVSHDHYIRTR